METQVPSGAPKTVSQRMAELQTMRFVDIRKMVTYTYKKPDGTPLMSYNDTLENRDNVKRAVLDFELAAGLIVPDPEGGVAAPPMPMQQPQMQQPLAVPTINDVQGQPSMNYPPMPQQPQFAAPNAPGIPQPQQPMGYPPAPPQGNFGPPPGVPPMAAAPMPQQPPAPPAAENGGAEQAAPTSGRGRRKAGTAAAPPPPAPTPLPAQAVPQAGFVAPPPPPTGAPGFAPPAAAPGFAPPAAAPGFAPQAAPQQAPVPNFTPGNPGVDLGPVFERLDAIGKIVAETANRPAPQVDLSPLLRELAEVKANQRTLLAAAHHMYLQMPELGKFAAGKANTLPDFLQFMQQFVGSPQ